MKAFVFPGQGVQYVGMGRKEWEASDRVRQLFERAESIVGPHLRQLMFEGPVDELDRTVNAQPAIFLTSYARYLLLGDSCDVAAGHSLGEYTALAATGVFSVMTALKLVQCRARYMQYLCDSGPAGSMALIKGLCAADLERLCSAAQAQYGLIVTPANLNSPDEIVISGHKLAVQKVSDWTCGLGALTVMPLRVAGAFHSPLMERARQQLVKDLNALTGLCSGRFPVYSSTTADRYGSTNDILVKLMKQLTAKVRWHATVEAMVQDGVTTFVDVGPRRVLYRLISSSFPKVASEIPGFVWEPARWR